MSADIEMLRARVAELQARFESYGGGDRPSSPPAALIRECIAAESALAEAVAAERKGAPYTVGDGLGTPEARPFLILSTKWSRGDNLSWWGPNRSGYTPCIAASCGGWAIAGRYTAEEARKIARPKEGSEPVLLADALALSVTVVPSDSAKVEALTKAGWEALSSGNIPPEVAPSRPRDTAPAWAAIGEIAAAVGLGEDASTQEVIDAVKRSEERGREAGIAWAVSFLREIDAGIARACANLIESEAKRGAK